MKPLIVNADLGVRVAVDSTALPWVASPQPGVERRMLERVGGEIARVTSLVRYAPGSRFSRHTHHGGEEILVLEGVYSDESGDFSAGAYLRNPVGSTHSPFTDAGCVILVKLYWMHARDRARVHIDTARASGREVVYEGVEALSLHEFQDER